MPKIPGDAAKLQVFLLLAVLLEIITLFLVTREIRLAQLDHDTRSSILALCAAAFGLLALAIWLLSQFLLKSHSEAMSRALSKLLSMLDQGDSDCYPTDIAEISERVVSQLEVSIQGQHLIADYGSDVLCCLSPDHKFLDLNARAEQLLGYGEAALLATPIEMIVLEEDKEKVFKYLEGCKNSANDLEHFIECRIISSGFQTFDWSLHCEWSKSLNCFFCIAKDITAVKENERLKAEITSMVTHDLRTPIAGFRFLLDNLRSENLGPITNLAKTEIECSKTAIDQVMSLIDQLLDVEKIEGGQMPVKTSIIVLSELYRDCESMVSGLAQMKNIVLVFPSSDRLVNADLDRTKQILSNLLSNAIKWSPENAEVVVSEELDGCLTIIKVTDVGPGIDPSKAKLIFERFNSFDDRENKELASSGLGLYLCKKLAELQNGDIGVRSELGAGSTFWFSLPSVTESSLLDGE